MDTATEIKITKNGKRWLKVMSTAGGAEFAATHRKIAVENGVDLASNTCRVVRANGKKSWLVPTGRVEKASVGMGTVHYMYNTVGYWL